MVERVRSEREGEREVEWKTERVERERETGDGETDRQNNKKSERNTRGPIFEMKSRKTRDKGESKQTEAKGAR